MYLRALVLGDALQIEFASTTGRSLARMCEISIDLDADSCSIRRVAEEPRCEFPVVPDRLVGEATALLRAVQSALHNSSCSMIMF